MSPSPRVRRALVSVSDKSNLAHLAATLIKHGIEVLSTGGTYEALAQLGVPVTKVSEYTGAPEILGGRVKTLHPKIHGGILAMATDAHRAELEANGIGEIDLVVVNLYPFSATIRRPGCSFADAIENIDIGGPTMVRASAKNWCRVGIVVDPGDYVELARALDDYDGTLPEAVRRKWARKAFTHTAHYDAAIASYFAGFSDDDGTTITDGSVSEVLAIAGTPMSELRYGENPHQAARWFACDYVGTGGGGLARARQHQGKDLSYNNLLDADAALALIRDLERIGSAAAVFKHLCPCGAALGQVDESLADTYRRARDADAESAFGGIVAVTGVVDDDLADALLESFLEVVLAPGFTDGARERLARKSNLRLLEIPDMFGRAATPELRVRSVAGALLVQREDDVGVSAAKARCVTARKPAASEVVAMDFAQVVAKHVRSNAIVLADHTVTVGIGGGQTSRVEAVRQAMTRAGDKARGSVLASDAFFPFRDSVDSAAAAGVAAIIQPGGSIRDDEVVAAADEHGLAMLCTGERHFRH